MPIGRSNSKRGTEGGSIRDQLPPSDLEIQANNAPKKSSLEVPKSEEKQAEQAKSFSEQEVEQIKNRAEVKQAVNEAQQIADTLKQSKQTANSYTEEVKPVKFKPMVLYIQNHIPKATNYESGEVKTVKFKPVVYIQNHIPKATNYGSGEFTTGGYIVLAVCAIVGYMLFVMFDKFVQWIKRKLKQCFERLKQCFKRS